MRWVFFLYGQGKAERKAFAKDLAPEGFRVRTEKYSRSPMLVLTRLAIYKEEELHTEIKRLRELCKRQGLNYDSLDVEDPKADDTSP